MSTHKTILDEHSRLDVLLRDLRKISLWDPALLREERVRLQLAHDLAALKLRLREHFDTEESGAYHEEISSRKPQAGESLIALQSEHPIFLQQVTSLANECLGGDEATAYNVVLNKLSWILDLLKRHEERENTLIKDVFQF